MIKTILDVALKVAEAIYILFLPGFLLSYVFFDRRAIDIVERVALSFALSLATVPLVVFYANLLGITISRLHVSLITLGVIVLAAAGIVLRRWYGRRR